MAASGTLAMALLLLAAAVSTAPSMSTTPAPDSEWKCPEVTVQANASLQQVVGEWFVLDLVGSPSPKPNAACSMLSFKDLKMEGENSRSLVLNVYRPRNDGSKVEIFTNNVIFHNDKPQEFIVGDLISVWRLHSLSADGRVLVFAGCHLLRVKSYWITLGVAHDVVVPRRAANSVRRDANLCAELADASDSTTSSNN